MLPQELPTPALLLELPVLRSNLERMQERARRWGVALRPHAKTHKCAQIAHLQLQAGACGVTVATVAEARFFADAGIEDITWAFPLPLWAIEPALELARRVQLRLVVDSLPTVEALESACARRQQRVHVWLEIDCGAHRCGIPPDSPALVPVASRIARSGWLEFDGILTHAGHAYRASSHAELRHIAQQEQEVMLEVAAYLQRMGIPVPGISIGSTPTLSVCETLLPGITEIRPGNYVFYDYTQVLLGSCRLEDCALTVLTTVVSHYPERGYLVTDAGALALSLDPGPQHRMAVPSFGAILEDEPPQPRSVNPHLRIARLFQEHGVIVAEPAEYLRGRSPVGSRLRILENHSCLTAALHDCYWVRDEHGAICDCWAIARQRM